MKEQHDFKMEILENGLDFILDAVEHFGKNSSQRDLKYGILHLAAGVELVLKARLQKHDWRLIFPKQENANPNSFKSGSFTSIGLEECIKRLEENNISELPDGQDKIFRSLKNTRNRIEHHGLTDSTEAIISSSTKVLGIIVDFISVEFNENDLSTKDVNMINKIRGGLSKFTAYVQDRIKEITPDLVQVGVEIVECPRCSQNTLGLDDGSSCKFCGYIAEGEEAAYEYVKAFMDIRWEDEIRGGKVPIYRCPECWHDSLVDIRDVREYSEIGFICFQCSTKLKRESTDFCQDCGNPFVNDTEDFMCEDCRQ